MLQPTLQGLRIVRHVRSRSCGRCGFALLEALVAVALLAIVGVVGLRAISSSIATLTHTRDSEARWWTAVQLLDAARTWDRSELDRRLGSRRQGPWTLEIERVGGDVYTLRVFAVGSSREMLSTAVTRPLK